MSWDPDRWRITNVFDSCHDVKQNTWPSICFPPVPLGKRSAGVRDYCYYSTHSSALAQCPTTINPHERPIGRSDIFHGHPPSAIRMKQRDSQLSRELLHELLKNKESSSTLSPPKKNNSNQKHFRRVCVCVCVCYRSQVTQSPTRSRLLRKDGPRSLSHNSLWRWWSVALRLVSWAVIFCDAGSHHSCFFFSFLLLLLRLCPRSLPQKISNRLC